MDHQSARHLSRFEYKSALDVAAKPEGFIQAMGCGPLHAGEQHHLAAVSRLGEIERKLNGRARQPAAAELRQGYYMLDHGEWPAGGRQIRHERNHAGGSQTPVGLRHDDAYV